MTGWLLAIDFGTTYTAAAVHHDGASRMVVLGSDGACRMPSAVWLNDVGSLIVGTTAIEHAPLAPERFERTPKRLLVNEERSPERLLGEKAVLLGETSFPASTLVGHVLAHIANEAARLFDDTRPDAVVITHPAAWTEVRLNLLRKAARSSGLGQVHLLPEPMASAIHFGANLPVGAHVAIFDFGGGTFDAAVLRRTATGFELAGPPQGVDPLGGEDFDQHILDHLGNGPAGKHPDWDKLVRPPDLIWRIHATALRRDVRTAKEALSHTLSYSLFLPGLNIPVQLTRAELDDLVRVGVEATVGVLGSTIDAAGQSPQSVAGIFLVGGSSRIPLITDTLQQRLDLRPTTQDDPKSVVALGAVTWLSRQLDGEQYNGAGSLPAAWSTGSGASAGSFGSAQGTGDRVPVGAAVHADPATDQSAARPTGFNGAFAAALVAPAAGAAAHLSASDAEHTVNVGRSSAATLGPPAKSLAAAGSDGLPPDAAGGTPPPAGQEPQRSGPSRRVLLGAGLGALVVAGTGGAALKLLNGPSDEHAGMDHGGGQTKAGTLRWSVATGSKVESTPALVGKALYVGSYDKNVHALDTTTGKHLWQQPTGGGIRSSPAVAAGVVYVGSDDGRVYALNAADGKPRWTYQTGGQVWSSPAVADGFVYVGSNDGRVFALNAATGKLRWAPFQTGGEVWGPPLVADGVVYIGSLDHRLYALDAATGEVRWQFEAGHWVKTLPTIVGDTIYFGSCDNYAYALELATQKVRWKFKTGDMIHSYPKVNGSTVYLGGYDKSVYALNAADGKLRWKRETGNKVTSTPWIAGNTLYIGSGDGYVYALATADGEDRWTYKTGGVIEWSSPVIADNTLYIGSDDGSVYAIAT